MKNKGFTLIELLAVIIVIAIIALIAYPTITGIVERTRKAAFKESVNNIITTGSNYVIEYLLKNGGDQLPYPIVFTCNGTSCINQDNDTLKFKGEVPISGTITLISGDNVYAEYVSNGKYCATGYLGHLEVGKTCADIDVTKPTISGELEGKKLKLTLTDNESGISGYCVNKTNDSSKCTWIDTNDDHVEYTLSGPGTYYAFAKDKKNNISDSIEFTALSNNFCMVEEREWTFDYNGTTGANGSIQNFTVPCDGVYKLEVWGAQGGGELSNQQGVGGYSTGLISLTKNNILYIGVGGKGLTGYDKNGKNTVISGGYNGGGNGRTWKEMFIVGGGGGATHIALNSNRGELKNYKDNKDEILIVAGGGGGTGWAGGASTYWPNYYGGFGGGATGKDGSSAATWHGTGGTQTAGGSQSASECNTIGNQSGFGQGGYSYCTWKDGMGNSSGGGGGWYGGGAGCGSGGFGGGGSGYIANSLLTDKKMVCYNCTTSNDTATKTESNTCHNSTATADCSKEGDGYAKITYLGD